MRTVPLNLSCRRCGGRLELQRAWTSTALRCRSCGAKYSLADYRTNLDDLLEAQLADTPCDRL